MSSFLRRKQSPADAFFLSVLGILVSLWIGFVLWDIVFCDDPGQMIFLTGTSGHPLGSFFFYSWFAPGRAVVLAQWLFLGASCLLYGHISGVCRDDQKTSRLFLFLGCAVVLLLITGAGDSQDHLKIFIQDFYANSISQQESVGNLFNLFGFLLQTALPAFALWRYRAALTGSRRVLVYLLTGFIFFLLAGFLSSIGNAWTWGHHSSINQAFGKALWSNLGMLGNYHHQILMEVIRESEVLNALVDTVLVDTLIRQSLQLIGASAYLAAGWAMLAQRKPRSVE